MKHPLRELSTDAPTNTSLTLEDVSKIALHRSRSTQPMEEGPDLPQESLKQVFEDPEGEDEDFVRSRMREMS